MCLLNMETNHVILNLYGDNLVPASYPVQLVCNAFLKTIYCDTVNVLQPLP